MAESMKGLHRSHRCAEVVNAAIGSEVTVMGWVQKRRNLGGMIFIDLRDRSGLLQIVFDENDIGTEGYEKAGKLRSEFVIAVTGKLEKRGGAVNENLATGELEVRAESLRILSESETPPFPIEEHIQTRDELRLKYRYLDLRRPNLQRNLLLRRSGNSDPSLYGCRRISGDRNTDPDQEYSGRCKRLPRTKPCTSGQFLCTAAVTAAAQTAAYVFRIRPLFPDRKMFP